MGDNLGELILFKIKLIEGKQEELTIYEIVNKLKIKGKCRKPEIVAKRRFFWLMLTRIDEDYYTQEKLGELTGGHNHSTISHGLKCLKNTHYIKAFSKEQREVYELFNKMSV
jgi:chromosomal replication initiation ATPase DnaA